jgi:hypothetical protein
LERGGGGDICWRKSQGKSFFHDIDDDGRRGMKGRGKCHKNEWEEKTTNAGDGQRQRGYGKSWGEDGFDETDSTKIDDCHSY